MPKITKRTTEVIYQFPIAEFNRKLGLDEGEEPFIISMDYTKRVVNIHVSISHISTSEEENG